MYTRGTQELNKCMLATNQSNDTLKPFFPAIKQTPPLINYCTFNDLIGHLISSLYTTEGDLDFHVKFMHSFFVK